jgi:hypothetical protein
MVATFSTWAFSEHQVQWHICIGVPQAPALNFFNISTEIALLNWQHLLCPPPAFSVSLITLDASYEWNYTMFVHLHLAYLFYILLAGIFHVAACTGNLFLYTMTWRYIVHIHPARAAHNYFHLLAPMNGTTMNTGVQMSIWASAYNSFGDVSRNGLLVYMVILCLNVEGFVAFYLLS